jgi:hypothetical protein
MTSILDRYPYPWENAVAQRLHRELYTLLPDIPAAELVANKIDLHLEKVNRAQGPDPFWATVLTLAAGAGLTGALVRQVHDELPARSPVRPFLAALLDNREGMMPEPTPGTPAQEGGHGPHPVFAEYIRSKTEGFVGREHIFREIQRFQEGWECGYLTLVADPGIGKTSVLCELTRRTGCVAHFFIRAEGIVKSEHFHRYVGDQLRERFGVDTTAFAGDPPSVRLRAWLDHAARAQAEGGPLLLVVDALDECEDTAAPPQTQNLLHLPRDLPKRVFVVMARRDLDPTRFNVGLQTEPDVANTLYDLMKFPAENRRDVEAYLRSYFEERPAHPWLIRHRRTAAEGVALLADLSENNFMYLRHVLPHLTENPEQYTPSTLPKGLKEYYFGHWNRMTAKWRDSPAADAMFQTVYLLAVAARPMSVGQLAGLLPEGSRGLVRTFVAEWREFLDQARPGEPVYRIYHASFSDFLVEQDEVAGARRVSAAAKSLKDRLLSLLRPGVRPHE